ncbi:MAG: histidine kinase [Bacteroidales bacterium]
MKRSKITRVVFHVIVWIVFIILPIFVVKRYRMAGDFLATYYAFAAVNALIFYANYLILVPKLFFRKSRYRYFIAALVLVISFYYLSDFVNGQVNKMNERRPGQQIEKQDADSQFRERPPMGPRIMIAVPNARLIGYTVSSLFMVFLSLGLRVLERQEEMEKSKLNAELAILKNQISPHFFFNTLNNIYSLIGRNNEDSKDAVIKLSRLMRYVLNESGEDLKRLSEEVEFMKNYIDLMRLRIGSRTRLEVYFPAECGETKIPHLLFISLIENAFKYGISVQEESFVKISLERDEDIIRFACENGLPETNTDLNFPSSGIGLENLKKRLGLIFPDRHELIINNTGKMFAVNLIIRL